MKKIRKSSVLAILMAIASAYGFKAGADDRVIATVQKNSFAYAVGSAQVTGNPFEYGVCYNLSGKVDNVYVDVYRNGTLAGTYEGTKYENANLIRCDLRRDMNGNAIPSGGTLTFKVRCVSPTNATPRLITDNTTSYGGSPTAGVYRFNAPWGLTINNCPTSPTFGTILVTEAKKWDGSSGTTYHSSTGNMGLGPGIYAFTPQFKPVPNITNSNKYGYTGNIACGSGTYSGISEKEHTYQCVRYTDDGRLFLATCDGSNQPIIEYGTNDVQNLNSTGTTVFSRANSGTHKIDHPISIAFWGTGSNLRMLAMYNANGAFSSGSADIASSSRYYTYAYNLGTNTSWTSKPTYDCASIGYSINFGHNAVFDNDGKGYTVMTSKAPDGTKPAYVHYKFTSTTNSSGMLTSAREKTNELDPNYRPLGIAKSVDGSLLAVQTSAHIVTIFEHNNSNGAQSLTELYSFNLKDLAGRSFSFICDLAFDYAGNLYATSNQGEVVAGFQLKNNTGNRHIVTVPDNNSFSHVSGASSVTSPSVSYANGKTTLTWGVSNLQDVKEFLVYRNGNLVATLGSSARSYSEAITSSSATTKQYYIVARKNIIGTNGNATSTIVNLATSSTVTANIPAASCTISSASRKSNNRVDLAWTTNMASEDIQKYYIYRNGTKIGETTSTSYSDTSISDANNYYYNVVAVSSQIGNVNSANSSTIALLGNAAVNLAMTQTDASDSSVNLSWSLSNVASGVSGTSYTLYCDGQAVAQGLTGNTYTHTMPSEGTHTYRLVANVLGSNIEAAQQPQALHVIGSVDLRVNYDSTENDALYVDWDASSNLSMATRFEFWRDNVKTADLDASTMSYTIGDPDDNNDNPDISAGHYYHVVAYKGNLKLATSNTVLFGYINPQFNIEPDVVTNEYGMEDIARFKGNLTWDRPMTREYVDALDGQIYVLSHYNVQLFDNENNLVDIRSSEGVHPVVECNGSTQGVTVEYDDENDLLKVNDPVTEQLESTAASVRRRVEGEADPLAATFNTTFENDDITFGTYTAKVTPVYKVAGADLEIAATSLGAEASNPSEQSETDFQPVSNLSVNAYSGTVKEWNEEGVLCNKTVYRSDIFFAKPDIELPVSFYTIEYKRSGQAEFSLLEDFWVIWGDDRYHYKAGETDLDDYEVPVPGDMEKAPRRVAKVPSLEEKTDFANNVAQGYILGSYDFTDGPQKAVDDAASTAVAFHYSDENPTDTEYKVTAYYGAPNAYLLAAGETNKSKVVGLNGGLIPTGVQAIEGDLGQLSAWPIPAHDVVNVQAPAAITKVEVYSTTGAMVKSIAADGQSSHATIDITDLPVGIYLLQVNDSMNIRIIKK